MGTLAYLKELFPPEAKFSVNDIPDLTGKVIIVTGANSGELQPPVPDLKRPLTTLSSPLGIGKETARVRKSSPTSGGVL